MGRHKTYNNKTDISIMVGRALWLLSPFVAYYILQRFYGFGMGEFLRTVITRRGILNLFILYIFWWGCYVITNRTKASAILTVLAAFLIGLTNYFVMEFRGSPLSVADIAAIGTAAEVAGGYRYTLDANAIRCLVHTVLYIGVTLALKSGKGMKWKKRLLAAVSFICLAVGFRQLFFESDYLKDHKIKGGIFNGSESYAENGTALSLVIGWTYYAVEKPQGYSFAEVEKITDHYESDFPGKADEISERRQPNIIAVMNETFADLNVVGELKLSEDAMPFVHQLKENTIKGNLHVSVLGGTTANTEFEFLTGATMAFLPYRSVPYNSYIRQPLPTLNTALLAQGYGGNIAFHPFEASGWKRDKVYPLLGFSEFISIDDMQENEKEYIRSFISDESDYSKVISEYEEFKKSGDSGRPFYLFNVTIQNHGGYDSSTMAAEDMVITITDEKQQNDAAQTYVNLIRKSDQAFEKLVKYFEQVEEPTILVLFGDHMPGLSGKFYRSLSGKKAAELSLGESMHKYEVPYVIWANYDIEEEERDMSANYLGAYVLKTAGVGLTGYQKYLLELMEKVPVITQNGYIGQDGVVRELDEKSEYSELLREYAKIQYNYLFDGKNRVEGFWK